MAQIHDEDNSASARVMQHARIEWRLFAALVCIGLIGLLMRAWTSSDAASELGYLAAPMYSDVLVFFGGCGSAGLICTVLFGQAGIERTQFWVFLTGVIGAAVLYIRTL